MDRRDFLKISGVAGVVGLLSVCGSVSAMKSEGKSKRPNILFCIADDWGYPHAAPYGDEVVKTPSFNRLAEEGVLFEHAYVSSPSCTPCRNAILTGQYHWRLKEGANLWSTLDVNIPVYPLLLEKAGYDIGYWRKSWGPATLRSADIPIRTLLVKDTKMGSNSSSMHVRATSRFVSG